jgi:protein translocase SecG subunit
MLPVVINILLAIHVLVSLLIVLIVLMQRPKNEGLGAAFGGGMTDNLFGAQTTNVLQTITRWLGGIFFALTLLLSILYVKQTAHKSAVQKKLSEAPAVVPATPAPDLPTAVSPAVSVDGTPVPAPAPAPAADAKAAPEAPKPAPVPADASKPAPEATKPADAAKPAEPATPAPAPTPPAADATKPAEPLKPALAPAPEAAPAEPAKPQN